MHSKTMAPGRTARTTKKRAAVRAKKPLKARPLPPDRALSGAAHCAQQIGRMERELADTRERSDAYGHYALQLQEEVEASREYIELLGQLVAAQRATARRAGIRLPDRDPRALLAAQQALVDEQTRSSEYKANLPAVRRRRAADAMLEMRGRP